MGESVSALKFVVSGMFGRIVDNNLFTPSLQESKLIALVLNYNLPTQTHKLLHKGATAAAVALSSGFRTPSELNNLLQRRHVSVQTEVQTGCTMLLLVLHRTCLL